MRGMARMALVLALWVWKFRVDEKILIVGSDPFFLDSILFSTHSSLIA